jgi:4-hydroxy 2-oxovalerate aldolase
MNNISILDCTLRDGGYINNFSFGKKTIIDIIDKLSQSPIEIIECGFMASRANDEDKSMFCSAEAIKNYLGIKKQHILYVAMIQYGAISNEEIILCDGTSIDGIRLTFHEHEIDGAFLLGKELLHKGYKVFMQPVGTTTYTDASLLNLIERINSMNPFAFYMVDTLGTMYKKDILRMFYLIDHNLNKNIALGFHSHNNLQLSFSNAQELILLNSTRNIILDASVFGMGRGAGNLCTELLIQYINENITRKYNLMPVLEIIDKYIQQLYTKYSWGYSVPYYIASIYNCHPNYATYLLNKNTIPAKEIHTIISMINENKRSLYDESYITALYLSYQKHVIDDTKSLERIKEVCSGKTALVLAPGKSLQTEHDTIVAYIKKETPIVFSVNFVPDGIPINCVFISNLRRFKDSAEIYSHAVNGMIVICTSNITTKKNTNMIVINYSDYLNSDTAISDNAGLMLLNMFHKIGIQNITLAGFDGFNLNNSNNYFNESLRNNADDDYLKKMNTALSERLNELTKYMHISFLTETKYKQPGSNEI